MPDEVDRWFSPRMNFLLEIALNQIPETLLCRDGFSLKHLLFLRLKRKATGQFRNRYSIASREFPSKRCIACIYLDLNTLRVCCCKLGYVPLVYIMEMYSLSGLAELGVRRWPAASRLKVSFEACSPINLLEVEVNYDVFFRYLDVMQLRCVNI